MGILRIECFDNVAFTIFQAGLTRRLPGIFWQYYEPSGNIPGKPSDKVFLECFQNIPEIQTRYISNRNILRIFQEYIEYFFRNLLGTCVLVATQNIFEKNKYIRAVSNLLRSFLEYLVFTGLKNKCIDFYKS